MNIDWSKAPEGATHYRKYNGDYPWYRLESDKRDYWNGVRWEISLAAIDHELAPIQQWSGEGLPPVGTDFETCNRGDGNWLKAKMLFAGKELGVMWLDTGAEYSFYMSEWEYRSIRTPEQIAAEERRNSISEMLAVEPAMTTCMAANLYDAGYRKFEIMEGE